MSVDLADRKRKRVDTVTGTPKHVLPHSAFICLVYIVESLRIKLIFALQQHGRNSFPPG